MIIIANHIFYKSMVFFIKRCYDIFILGVIDMLNNKGFAVSTILYTLLIAFLLFLGATLAMFSSSNSIISNANDDLINGIELNPQQVKPVSTDSDGNDNCVPVSTTQPLPDDKYYWYQVENNILVRITSRYGVMYWPRDFGGSVDEDGILRLGSTDNGNIRVTFTCNEAICNPQIDLADSSNIEYELKVCDKVLHNEEDLDDNTNCKTIRLGDICR